MALLLRPLLLESHQTALLLLPFRRLLLLANLFPCSRRLSRTDAREDHEEEDSRLLKITIEQLPSCTMPNLEDCLVWLTAALQLCLKSMVRFLIKILTQQLVGLLVRLAAIRVSKRAAAWLGPWPRLEQFLIDVVETWVNDRLEHWVDNLVISLMAQLI